MNQLSRYLIPLPHNLPYAVLHEYQFHLNIMDKITPELKEGGNVMTSTFGLDTYLLMHTLFIHYIVNVQ